MPSGNHLKSQPIAFVYQESKSSPPNYKIHWENNKDGSENINEFAKSVINIRDQIKFLTKAEINNMFQMEAPLIRPFNDEEKIKIFS